MSYYLGNGQELLSVNLVYHASNVFPILKVPSSKIDVFSVTPNEDYNSCPLPGQYNILFIKHSQLFTFLFRNSPFYSNSLTSDKLTGGCGRWLNLAYNQYLSLIVRTILGQVYLALQLYLAPCPEL